MSDATSSKAFTDSCLLPLLLAAYAVSEQNQVEKIVSLHMLQMRSPKHSTSGLGLSSTNWKHSKVQQLCLLWGIVHGLHAA